MDLALRLISWGRDFGRIDGSGKSHRSDVAVADGDGSVESARLLGEMVARRCPYLNSWRHSGGYAGGVVFHAGQSKGAAISDWPDQPFIFKLVLRLTPIGSFHKNGPVFTPGWGACGSGRGVHQLCQPCWWSGSSGVSSVKKHVQNNIHIT